MENRKLKIKVLSKKPVAIVSEVPKESPVTDGIAAKSTSKDNQMPIAPNSEKRQPCAVGTKRRLDGSAECPQEKRLKMDRAASFNCGVILRKLMNSRNGWVFNRPVDPVVLGIPDYFQIIKNPMDFGTIKKQLQRNRYEDIEKFEADVRLTFSNAMLYNPPSYPVHQYAKELLANFDTLWKPIKAKITRQHGSLKEKMSGSGTSIMEGTDNNCLKGLSSSADKLPGLADVSCRINLDNLQEVFVEKKVPCIKQTVKDKTARGSESSKTSRTGLGSLGPLSRVHNETSSSMSIHSEVSCVQSVQSEVKVLCGNPKEAKSQMRNKHSEVVRDKAKEATLQKKTSQNEVVNSMRLNRCRSDPDSNGTVSCFSEEKECTSFPQNTGTASVASADDEDAQLSPSKALRKAMLKSRFAETILNAQCRTQSLHGGAATFTEMKLEKERIERIKREEKARIEAQVRAAELAARSKAKSECRRQREQERETARIALEEMERSVDVDDNFHVLKELEKMLGSPLFLIRECRNGRTLAVWDQLESDNLGSPLERLGLFIKAEYMGGDDDDDLLLQAEEWEEGEVIF